MLARLALPPTQSAHIVNDQIKLGGGGWGGTFVGQLLLPPAKINTLRGDGILAEAEVNSAELVAKKRGA